MEERSKWDRLVEGMGYSVLSGNGQSFFVFFRIQLRHLTVLFMVLSGYATALVNCCGTGRRCHLS